MSSGTTKTFRSYSSEETKKFGEKFGRIARKNPMIVALAGDLGSGKTTFAQGFLKGAGGSGRVSSPTFVIMRRHTILRGKKDPKSIFHVDAYRLKKSADLGVLGLVKIFSDPENTVLIEWPERIRNILPKRAIRLMFRHGKKQNERDIILK